MLKVAKMPRYVQQGEVLVISKNGQYLVLNLSKLNAFDAVNDFGDPTVWATIEWNGVTKVSRMVKKPQLNQTFHFKMSLTKEQLAGNKQDLTDAIMDELKTAPEVKVSVWADCNNGQINFLGVCRIQLRDIANANFQDRSFTDMKTREKFTYQTRVLSQSLKLKSARKEKASSMIEF